MLDIKVGFIGAGRMAQALSKGFINAGLMKPDDIIASDVEDGMLKFIAESGVRTTKNNLDVVSGTNVVVIAVKPNLVARVLQEVHPSTNASQLFISIAAGTTIEQLENLLPERKVVRVMPNTPALIGCGASVFSLGKLSTAEDGKLSQTLFSSVGICHTLPETYLDAVTGLSGSGPAYGFIAIEALADGGVRAGLPRDVAQQLAAQTMLGAAKMVLESGKHPGELKDAVCSPGGTTIAGVHQLEENSFRASLINAVVAATNRSKELAKL